MVVPQQVPPIAAGYAYALRIELVGGALSFPTSGSMRAEVRDYPGAPSLAGLLTTTSGMISIVDAQTIEIFFSAALTGALARRTCAVDLVRTDTAPERWMGVQLLLPVVTTVTRSPADSDSPARIVVDKPIGTLATISAPIGVGIILSGTDDPGPWNQVQTIACEATPSTSRQASPAMRMQPALTIGPPLLAATIFAPAVFTLFAAAMPTPSTASLPAPRMVPIPPLTLAISGFSAVSALPAPQLTSIPPPASAISPAVLLSTLNIPLPAVEHFVPGMIDYTVAGNPL